MKMVLTGEQINDVSESIKSARRDEVVMELYEDKWLIKCSDASNVIMVAILMPRGQMSHYERGEYEYIGIPWNKLKDFVSSGDDEINMWMESRTLYMDDNSGARADIATIDPDSVGGWMKNFLDVGYEVEIKRDLSWITDFIKRAEPITGSDSYMIGVREEGAYLYMKGDNGRMSDFSSKDEFDSFSVDWSINNLSESKGALVPKKDEGVDVIMATDFTKEINTLSGTPRINIANHFPMKVVYDELGEDSKVPMKVSYIQTPRIAQSEDVMSTLPDEVLER